MNEKFEFEPVAQEPIVYVRPVAVADLPGEERAQAGDLETLWAVHDSDGARLALVADRKLAFILARQNELRPVSAH